MFSCADKKTSGRKSTCLYCSGRNSQKGSRSEARPEKMELMRSIAQTFHFLSCELLQIQNIPGLEGQISSTCTELPEAQGNVSAPTPPNEPRHRSSDGTTDQEKRRLSTAKEKLAIVLLKKK